MSTTNKNETVLKFSNSLVSTKTTINIQVKYLRILNNHYNSASFVSTDVFFPDDYGWTLCLSDRSLHSLKQIVIKDPVHITRDKSVQVFEMVAILMFLRSYISAIEQ